MKDDLDSVLREYNQAHMDGGQDCYFSLAGQQLTIRPQQRWWMEAHRKKAIPLLQLKEDDHFIDLGCGEGFLTLPLAAQVKQTVGLDIAGTALKLLRQQTAFNPKTTLPAVSQGNMLPLPNQWGNKLFCNHTLEHVLDDDALLKEMNRVLKPGGLLLIGVPLPLNWQTKRLINLRRWLRPKARKLQLEIAIPGKLVPELIGVQSHIRFYDLPSLKNLLQRNGFDEIRIEGIGFGWRQQKVRDFIRRHHLLFGLATWLGQWLPAFGDGVLILGKKR